MTPVWSSEVTPISNLPKRGQIILVQAIPAFLDSSTADLVFTLAHDGHYAVLSFHSEYEGDEDIIISCSCVASGQLSSPSLLPNNPPARLRMDPIIADIKSSPQSQSATLLVAQYEGYMTHVSITGHSSSIRLSDTLLPIRLSYSENTSSRLISFCIPDSLALSSVANVPPSFVQDIDSSMFLIYALVAEDFLDSLSSAVSLHCALVDLSDKDTQSVTFGPWSINNIHPGMNNIALLSNSDLLLVTGPEYDVNAREFGSCLFLCFPHSFSSPTTQSTSPSPVVLPIYSLTQCLSTVHCRCSEPKGCRCFVQTPDLASSFGYFAGFRRYDCKISFPLLSLSPSHSLTISPSLPVHFVTARKHPYGDVEHYKHYKRVYHPGVDNEPGQHGTNACPCDSLDERRHRCHQQQRSECCV
eukprot:TRINITY_DN2769_c0_g1_i2.p1 TRINITY_DN2769_c0_g1~~TRINITY_DN2769_c0_g1_i2.p1  ORF type:complete len:474 (+),score=38.45 TRINITY_DN2769_c0_g1_i2:183-1424(+)